MVDWETFYGAFREPGFLPGYEVLHHLGGGAFGEVYQVRKTSIGKLFAVKFLKLDDETARRAVERELDQVRLFAAIDHPNLVTIEDMGVVRDVPYLIMGYAGEDTLAKRIRRRDLKQDVALHLFAQVAAGVLALHERRLAHFDLKPSNVFLNGDTVRVGDYGLAKLLAEGQQTLSVGRGTPQYMAPEMLTRRADERADIYSLGLILFECLAFEPAFPSGAGGGQWTGVLRENDAPPSFPAGIPAYLQKVIAKCVRLDPVDRYQDVVGMLRDLNPGANVVQPDDADGVRVRLSPDSRRGNMGELKGAARELVRGAAGVAQGVWSGVRGRTGDETPTVANAGSSTESSAFGSEVLSVSGLDGTTRLEPESATVDDASKRSASGLFPYGPGAVGATLPVPPRAAGGPLEFALNGLALGVEILGGIVTGPFLLLFRSAARAVDRMVRKLPQAFSGVSRFVLFLGVWAFLGALTTGLVLVALTFLPL